jgi:hypothetical protein
MKQRRQTVHDQEVVGSNPGTDIDVAAIILKENTEIKVARKGTPKKKGNKK